MIKKFFMSGLMPLGMLLAMQSVTGQAQDTSADAREGKELFTANQCWQCHGHEG